MKFLPRCFTLAAAAALATASVALAGQPHMRGSIELLEAAKTANHPLPLLKDARADLETAAHDKGGKRVEGIELVNEAIEAAKEGRHEKMVDKIDHAIAALHTGIERGKK